jgi:hypothetical protein
VAFAIVAGVLCAEWVGGRGWMGAEVYDLAGYVERFCFFRKYVEFFLVLQPNLGGSPEKFLYTDDYGVRYIPNFLPSQNNMHCGILENVDGRVLMNE